MKNTKRWNYSILLVLILCLSTGNLAAQNSEGQQLTVELSPIADFKIVSLPIDVSINLTALNSSLSDLTSLYSIVHNHVNEKIVTAQVTGGTGNPQGIVLKAELTAPAAGDAVSNGQVEILDGSGVIPLARTVIEKVPAGSFSNLALHYQAVANVTAAIGNQQFTVTFTISE